MIYKFLLKHIIFPIAEFYSKTSIQRNLRFLRQTQYWPKSQLESYQQSELSKILTHAYETVPYYTELFEKSSVKPSDIMSIKDLSKLPILTKTLVSSNFEKLKSRSRKYKTFIKFTSGSTGTPTRFLRATHDYSWEWAAHYRGWEWAGYDIGDKFVKISLNNDRDKPHKIIQDAIMRCDYLYVYGVSPQDLDRYIEEIYNFEPKFIYGYSSSLIVLSERMAKLKMTYKARAVITMGSKLLPSSRRQIEHAFKCKVYDGYGCGGEGLNVALQCEKGSYHINEELMIVEVVNGEIVITSLVHYAMPLIRYKPDDLVILGDLCECGRTLKVIKSVSGRSNEVIKTRSGKVLVIEFIISAFEFVKGVMQYRVVQENLDGIKVEMVVDDTYDRQSAERSIHSFISKAAGKSFKVEFIYLDSIPLEKNGKFKIIVSKLSQVI